MKRASFTLPRAALALALLTGSVLVGTAQAGAQWKWKDTNGAVQYSDRPPPAGTPDQNILSRPLSRMPVVRATSDAASAASSPNAQAPGSVDPELEARRKKAEADKQAKKKVDDEKVNAQRADNCQRAKGYQRSLQDGQRITRTNANGEREVLDDKARAEELQRTQELIASDCK